MFITEKEAREKVMKIVIVGAGGIGLLLGSYLSRGGHEVIFVEIKEEITAAINLKGIGVMGAEEENEAELVFTPAQAVQEPRLVEKCDAVFLTVKSFDTIPAIKSVSHLIRKDSPVLSLQTGLGNIEKMEKVERRNNIVGGFTYMAAACIGPGRVRIGGTGKTFLGELDGTKSARCERLSVLFEGCGLEVEQVPDIVTRLWTKVLVYSAINPLSGILRVKNGQLLEAMESISLAKRLLDEGKEVAEAHGVSLGDFDLYELFFDTCKKTTGNISSMLLDLIMGRRTEIEALNGEIFRLGQEKMISAGTHQAMMELVKLGEKWGAGFQKQV